MKKFYYLTVLLFFSVSFLSCQSQTAKSTADESTVSEGKTEVYYFHNTRRCATCKAVEAVTKEALDESFKTQMENGSMTFESLNVEEKKNEPLARELHVSGQTLLIVKDGKKKDLTNDAFMYARSNPDKLKEKITRTINNM